MNVLTTKPKTLGQISVVYLYILKERKVQNFLQISSKMELKHLCHEVISCYIFLIRKSDYSNYYGEKNALRTSLQW